MTHGFHLHLRLRAVVTSVLGLAAATALAVAPAAVASSGLPCSYDVTIIDGPSYPPDFPNTSVTLCDMNDAGVAVGSIRLLDPLPCIWSEEGGLKYIPTPPGLSEGTAVKINNNGWVLMDGEVAAEGSRAFVGIPSGEAWAWIKLEPVSGSGGIWALDINDKNEVVGKQSAGGPGQLFPLAGFRWALGEPLTTIQIAGWSATECHGINDDGIICGNVSQGNQASEPIPSTRGFVMTAEEVVILEPLSPYTRSTAKCVTGEGLIGGNMLTGTSATSIGLGYLFELGARATTLLPVPTGFSRWSLADLDDCGGAVGSARTPEIGATWRLCVAFDGVVTPMSGLIDPTFVANDGGGCAINDEGRVVGGCVAYCARIYHPMTGMPTDLNCDGVVDVADLYLVLETWGSPFGAADVNSDGVVDAGDLGEILANWTPG